MMLKNQIMNELMQNELLDKIVKEVIEEQWAQVGQIFIPGSPISQQYRALWLGQVLDAL